jgi:hypothetical protein
MKGWKIVCAQDKESKKGFENLGVQFRVSHCFFVRFVSRKIIMMTYKCENRSCSFKE